jgi:hypothetical protein
LAAANHLHTDDLLVHVTGRSQQLGAPARYLTADQLAAVSRQPRRSLLLALPELRATTPDAATLPQHGRTIAMVNRTTRRPACRRCTAARGILGESSAGSATIRTSASSTGSGSAPVSGRPTSRPTWPSFPTYSPRNAGTAT